MADESRAGGAGESRRNAPDAAKAPGKIRPGATDHSTRRGIGRLRSPRRRNDVQIHRPSTLSISATVNRGVMCFGQFQSHASTVRITARSTGAL